MEAYLDNSATTKPYSEVVDEMVLSLTDEFGNPSSSHRKGFSVEKKIRKIRKYIAGTLGVEDKNIVFTSGGTESNNAVLRSAAGFNRKRNHIITTKIEHPSVLRTAEELEREGFEVTYLDVDSKGMIDLKALEDSIKENTALVSVMFVNNEIGTVEPVKEIASILSAYPDVFFHVDAVQAYGKINFRLSDINVDFMSVSGHKIHGPKGIGFMYIKDVNRFRPFITGGGQEHNLRSGTENVPGIYGMGKACEILFEDIDSKIEKMRENRDYLYRQIKENIDGIKLNSDPENGVCHILNISLEGVKGEVLLHYLGDEGVYVSTGSACSSKKKGSHVLGAIGLTASEIDGAVRFSLSDTNTREELDYTVKMLKKYVDTIRVFSRKRR